MWSYAGGDRPVLSWPVSDAAGNLFVLVGIDAEPDPDVLGGELDRLVRAHYRMSGINLVSLTPDGEVRWEVELAEPDRPVPRELRWRPAVGPGGDVWVCIAQRASPSTPTATGDLTRISSAGAKLWTAEGACASDPLAWRHDAVVHRHAIAEDGTFFLVALEPIPDAAGDWVAVLRAIGPDGTPRWQRTIGVPSQNCCNPEAGGTWGTEVDAPLILPDGSVACGCDVCEPNQAGLARFDPASGTSEMLFATEAEHVLYTVGPWDGARVYADLEGGGGRWQVTLDGVASSGERVALASNDGVALDATIDDEQVSFEWDASEVVVPSSALSEDRIFGAIPIAIVEPDAVLLAFTTSAVSGDSFPCVEECGLAVVDRHGELLWRRTEVFGGTIVPAVGDGHLVYIEAESQRLVAVEAPVTAVAEGPWPSVGGNPSADRRAR